jgi:hypothetical protein
MTFGPFPRGGSAGGAIYTAVKLSDDEIFHRALERLSDEDLEFLHLSDDFRPSRFPQNAKARHWRYTPSVVL